MLETNFKSKTWIYPGLFWGLSLFLFIYIILPVMDGESITKENFYVLPLWLIIGLVMQYFLQKWISKKRRQ